MEQVAISVRGRDLSWLDFGGPGPVLLALHGVFGRASLFAPIADRVRGRIRLVAFDQRGHGLSQHGGPFTRDEFVADTAAVLRQRYGGQPVAVLGHSLGGITAYQLAARHPELVRVLLVEDVGPVMRRPEVAHPVLDVRGWPAAARTREALADAIRAQGVPDPGYFLHSAIGDDRRGWRLLFDYGEMMAVQEHGVGDWWSDWLGSRCPALVLRGGHSTLLPAALAADMARRRPNTRLVEFPDAGHWIHDDNPDGCARAILEFLAHHPE